MDSEPECRKIRVGRRHLDRLRIAPTLGASLWLLIITGFVVIAILKIDDQRRVAVSTTCAIVSAIADAGQTVIVNSAQQAETPFTRRLEALGYAKPAVRVRQANAAALAYRQQIAGRVAETVGGKARGVVNGNGSINCSRLVEVATGGFP